MILAGFAFFLLAALALLGLIAERVSWQAKLVLVALTPVYGFALWHAIYSQAGWPVAKGLPERALFISSVVDEPKAIYVTLIPEPPRRLPFDYKPSDGEPRLYRLPYSRQQQAALQKAAQAQAQGRHVGVKLVHGDGTRIPRNLFRSYQLPAPLPPKEVAP